MGGNVTVVRLVLNIQSHVMGNATAAWTSVETSALFLLNLEPPPTSTCARTSALTTL